MRRSISEIKDSIDHRPWPLSNARWKYYQEWNNALFLHWKVDPFVLRSFVPKALDIDVIDGQAWVSIVVFDMQQIRPRYLPAVTPISDFHEINIRTYVRHKGKSGVYFLNIEASKQLSASLARAISALPYVYSKMTRKDNYVKSVNMQDRDSLEMNYTVGQAVSAKTQLDEWLTERYALFQAAENKLNAFEIHHVIWPLHKVEVQNLRIDYPRFNDIFQFHPDAMHYSPGVQVLAWGKEVHKLTWP